jgi:hypothetical protein
VFLHEVAHNLQADLGIWQENRRAVVRRIISSSRDPFLASVYGRWHKEIFADLAAVLLGGPAAAWGMADFLAHPAPRTLTFRPGGAHPTAYLRVYILAEMLRRIGFTRDAAGLLRVWQTLYGDRSRHRIPVPLMTSAPRVIPAVVDEIAFQTRRNLAQHALVDIIAFTPAHQQAIRAGARRLAAGQSVADLPPRHVVSAAHYALEEARLQPAELSQAVIRQLTAHLRQPARQPSLRTEAPPLRLAA